jgi:hypothetical protein
MNMGRRMRSIYASLGKGIQMGIKRKKLVKKLKENASRFKN